MSDGAIWESCFRVVVTVIDDSIRSRVHEKCDFQLLDSQLRVVFRGVTAVESRRINPDDTIGREECDREVEQDTPAVAIAGTPGRG